MKKIAILTDSHSGITQEEAERTGIKVLPMPFYFGETCYYEEMDLTREEFFRRLAAGENVSTSQPSPESVKQLWKETLEEYEQIVYIPISSGLSGSCMTAAAMAQDEPFAGKVFVVDNGRVSTPLHRSVLDAVELRERGADAAKIKKILEDYRDRQVIYVGVDTLEYLKRGGRVSTTAAMLGNILNIKPVLKFDVGTLDVFRKCRGTAKMRRCMIEALRDDMPNRFKEWYDKGRISLLAASSASKETTEDWVAEIREAFPGMEVMCDNLSLGVSCHIGPEGLGIGCSCRPVMEE